MDETKKSYYAIIPANVRYDKRLPANSKLLYGEITALTNEKGFCWASNNYFSELYGVSHTSISTWIKKLKDNNYIKVELIFKKGSAEIEGRYIRILGGGVQENLKTPPPENLKDNNTSINNTINNKGERDKKVKVFLKPDFSMVAEYCRENHYNIDVHMFMDYYESNGWKVGNNPMKDWKATVRTWNRRNFKNSPAANPERKSLNDIKKDCEELFQ